MSALPSPATLPMVILYGLGHIGKPKAAVFKGSDVPAARKAAAKVGLSIIEVADQAARIVAAKLPPGRIGAHADKVASFVSKETYAQIEALNPGKEKSDNGSVRAAQTVAQAQRLPTSWDDIKIGDLVLAQDDDPADGWWRATVIEINGDLFKLRWRNSSRGRPFQKHRVTLGLICPGDSRQKLKPNQKKSSEGSGSVYPPHWSAIGLDQIVLAKEDGPCQQWWEAKTIKLEKEVFTLQWRDHPDLPPIMRPRTSLGLIHPAPKTR